MSQPNLPPPALPGISLLELGLLKRLYRTTALVAAFTGLMIWSRFSVPAALGWLVGVSLSLSMYWLLETTVTRFLAKENANPTGLVLASLGKMLGLVVVGVLLALGAKYRAINLLWVVGGVTLPHVVLVLKLVGRQVVAASNRAAPPRGSASRGAKDTPPGS